MPNVKNSDEILRALLDTEMTPEKEVPMRRFGFNFRIKAISEVEIRQAREQATYGKEVDQEKLATILIVKSCVVPDWTDRAITDKFGPTPVDAVDKRLLPGEKSRLGEEVLALSGYGDDELTNVKN